MPAALDVDWEAIKTLAIAVGAREAARRIGISEDAVRQRCTREGWLKDLPRSQQLPPTVLKPVAIVASPSELLKQELQTLNGKSRLSMARGLSKAAAHIETMDGQEIVEDSQNVKATAQSLALVHGWSASSAAIKLDISVTSGGKEPTEAVEAEWVDCEPTE